MSTLLVGTEAIFSNETSIAAGYPEAYKFVAGASGTLDTIRFTVSDTNPCTCTSLFLGIYSDSSGPDALLGSDEVVGTPALGAVVEVNGLSVPIVNGTTYWLAFMGTGDPVTQQVCYEYANTGGLVRDVDGGPFDDLQDPWTSDSEDTFGPATLAGYEGGDGGPITESALTWQVTGLWTPAAIDAGSPASYGLIADPQDGSVEIPLNDSRTARVTVSIYDETVTNVIGHAYARCLKVHYHGVLIFWGPIKLIETDLDAGTVTYNAVDPSLRMIRHYVRRGDINGDLGADTDDRATIPIDQNGVRVLRDAANNIAEQTLRGVPNLGVIDGFNDFVAAPDNLMGVARGDQVWSTILELCASLGPDIELEPVETVVGAYARVNTFINQGTDLTSTVQFHYGGNKSNLDNLTITEGSKYTTHVHVLDRNLTYRVTPANLATSAETGPYVDWDATDYDAENVPQADAEAVLLAYGNDVLRAYSVPLVVVNATLPLETDSLPRYLRDFSVGDIIGIAGSLGNVTVPEHDYRITKVTIGQEGDNTRTALDVVASFIPETDSEED